MSGFAIMEKLVIFLQSSSWFEVFACVLFMIVVGLLVYAIVVVINSVRKK